jgi:nicotinate-nucleotide adenylyltransferase
VRKIGIYGGTFDPIHHAHLLLAREALELFQLEKVIFVPAAVSPFKDAPSASAKIRLSMVRAAIAEEPKFSADDCDVLRGPPSYTIDTVKEIGRRELNAELYYLVGEDNVPGLPKWHRFGELEKMVRFVVLDRGRGQRGHPYPTVRRRLDISATEIRNRVASGRSIRYFVPGAVEEIIRQGNLYREHVK